jgi:hypothetical protein
MGNVGQDDRITLTPVLATDGGMKAEDAKRLKELELQNARLKTAVADLTLDKQILEEALKLGN